MRWTAQVHWLFPTIALCAALAPIVVQGQDAPAGEALPYAHLHVSLEVGERIGRAQDLAARGAWETAARILDEAFALAGDALTQVEPGLFISSAAAVRREILSWPEAGLAVYRATVDRAAAEALSEARRDKDLPLLLAAFERYFASSSGNELGETAGELALEAGEFAVAAGIYALLIESHPQRGERGARWRGLLAIAHALNDNWEEVDRVLAAPDARDAIIRWMGGDLSVERIVADIRSAPRASPADVADWPMFGGNLARNRSTALQVTQFTTLWRYEDSEPGDAGSPPDAGYASSMLSRVDPRLGLSRNAVYAEGLVVYQDAFRVHALRQSTGSVAWRYEGVGAGIRPNVHEDEDVPAWYSPTIAGGRVYAALGGHLRPYYGVELPDGYTALVCLEAASGRELWRREGRFADTPYATVEFDSSVLVRGDWVYAVERRRRNFGFEDCVLLGLDARDGSLRWQTHLGSASIGGFGERRPTMALPAYRDGILYVATNLGTVAAVSALTGQVAWLRAYAGAAGGSPVVRMPWRYNAVIVDGLRLVCFPLDSDKLLVLERSSGLVILEIPAGSLGDAEYIAGVEAGRIYTVGNQVGAFDMAAGSVLWTAELPEDDRAFGRATLTRSAVLVPRESRLCVIDRREGRREDFSWDSGVTGGNLLAAGDRLIVAGRDHVTALARVDSAWEELRARMRAEAESPAAALDVAELALRTGHLAEAQEALSEAVRRAERVAPEAAAYHRLFDAHLALADVMAGSGADEAQDAAIRLYTAAQRFAQDANSRLRCRRPLGALLTRLEQYARAVDVYQEMLSDAEVRELPVERAPGGMRVQRWCAERIGELIEAHGPEVYAAHAAKADQLAAKAQAAGDAEGLRGVADAYPNAPACAAARAALGDLLCARGDFTTARKEYVRALDARGQALPDEKLAQIHGRLAVCAQAEGRARTAQRWIRRAEFRFPDVQVEHRGEKLGWSALAVALGLADSAGVGELPSWRSAPAATASVHISAGGTAELLPFPSSPAPGQGYERFFVYSENGIRAFTIGQTESIWPAPAPVARHPLQLFSDDARAVFATGFELFAVDVRTGERIWTVGGEPEGVQDPAGDPEDFPRQRYFAVDGGRVIAMRTDGQAMCVSAEDGRTLWTRAMANAPSGPIELAGDYFAYPTTGLALSTACVCAAQSGRIVQTLPSPLGQPVRRVLFTDDDQVLLVSAAAVSVFDLASGTFRWSHAAGERLAPGSVTVDVDGVYVSSDGYGLVKLALWDGTPVWEVAADRVGRADRVALVRVGERMVLATEDEAAVIDAVSGRRLARWRLEADARVDRWEFLNKLLVGMRFADARTVNLRIFALETADLEAPPIRLNCQMPAGRADVVLCGDGGLVVGGAGTVVSFGSP